MPVQFFARRGIYYGWVVVATMFVTLFMVLGLRFAFGVFYVAILADTGWQRAETAAIFSISMAVYTLTIIPSGAAFDRYGPRRVFPVAIVLLAVGVALCSTIASRWQFYAYYGVLVGFSFALLGFPTHMAVVPRWFVQRRGLAAALTLSGVGVGSLVITLLSERLIVALGWRDTYLLYAGIILLVLVPLNALLHRDNPAQLGLHPNGTAAPAAGAATSGATLGGVTLWRSMQTPAWWMLFIAVSMIGLISMTLVVHQTRLSLDYGYSLATASALFGITGMTRSVGQLTWGALSDRFGRNPVYLAATLMGVVGLGFLWAARGAPEFAYLLAFVLVFGFGYLGMSPVYAAAVADLFPGRHLGKILAALDIGFGIGASSGPWLAGYLYDRHGHHDFTLLLLLGGVLATGAAMYAATLRGAVTSQPAS